MLISGSLFRLEVTPEELWTWYLLESADEIFLKHGTLNNVHLSKIARRGKGSSARQKISPPCFVQQATRHGYNVCCLTMKK